MTQPRSSHRSEPPVARAPVRAAPLPLPGVGWGNQVALAGLSLAVGLLGLAVPVFSMQVFDRVLSSGQVETLWVLGLAAAIALAGQTGLDFLRRRIAARLAGALWRQRATTGRPADLATLHGFLTGAGPLHLFDLLVVPPMILVLGLIHWLPAVLVCGVAVLAAIAAACGMRALQPDAGGADTADDALGPVLGETAIRQSARTAAARAQATRFDRRHVTASLAQAANLGLRLGLQLLLVATSVALAIAGSITLGGAIAVSILGLKALGAIEAAVRVWPAWQAARNLAQTMSPPADTVLPESPSRQPESQQPVSQQPMLSGVRVDGAVVGYPGRRLPVLRQVSLDLAPGERIAVTGAAGSGKSTLARLLVGVAPPMMGQVTVGDLPAGSAGAAGRIGYVPQALCLPAGTIGEILCGFDASAAADADARLRALGLAETIARLPDRLDTVIHPGSDGLPLSYVEQRLLMLARALARPRALLVLDEIDMGCTADEIARIDRQCARIQADGCTVVQVTTRLAELEKADRAITVADGLVRPLDRNPKRRLHQPAA